jgi:tripeptide aminopeptidase
MNLDDTALRFLFELLDIDGPSGDEGAVAAWIRARLREAGVPESAMRDDGAAARIGGVACDNLVVDPTPDAEGPRRLFAAHMDTVAGAVGASWKQEGDRLVVVEGGALGGDDRAGIAAILAAYLGLRDEGKAMRPLRLVFTVHEEGGVLGSRHLDPEVLKDVTEGFAFDGKEVRQAVIASPGQARMKIRVEGVTAHAGTRPHEGASAVIAVARALARLDREGMHGRIERDGVQIGTANVGALKGGEATNVVAPSAELVAEARSNDPDTLAEIVEAWRRAFEEEAAAMVNHEGRTAKAVFESWIAYHPFDLGEEGPAMDALVAALEPEGQEPVKRRIMGGLDANWLVRHGVPTLTLGCGYWFNHTPREHVKIPEFLRSVRVAQRLMLA